MTIKPKKLYRYNTHHELEKHTITKECLPQVALPSRGPEILFRCKHQAADGFVYQDFYGYGSQKEAKEELRLNIIKEIVGLRALYKKKFGDLPGCP